jgi:hypothetical protein
MALTRSVLIVVLLLFATVLDARERGLLVTYIPAGTETATIMSAVKSVLSEKSWVVEQEDATSVVARYWRAQYRARIRISLVGGNALAYEDVADLLRVGNPAQSPSSNPISSLPESWIDSIAEDIGAALSIPPIKLPASPGR